MLIYIEKQRVRNEKDEPLDKLGARLDCQFCETGRLGGFSDFLIQLTRDVTFDHLIQTHWLNLGGMAGTTE